MVDEWDTRILTIHSVTDDAIMRKCFLAVGPRLGRIAKGVLLALVAYEYVMLGVGYCFGFQFSWTTRFAPRYPGETSDCGNNKEDTHFSLHHVQL
ncbi:MAG TPA: hypothetical protein VFU55_04460 [Terracidiphilus sp.]|nr:hypothetical protein [Terracidiphilus sp.]